MRLSLFLLATAVFSAHAAAVSQEVTYSGDNVKLITVFKEIKKQTGYFIAYDLALVQQAKPVTVRAVNQPLDQFMHQVLNGQNLEFSIKGNTIVIIPKPTKTAVTADPVSPPFDPQSITGKVVDSLGKPLQDVTIWVTPANVGTFTKIDGRFFIDNIVPGSYTLEVSSVGFQTIQKKFRIKGDQPLDLGTITLTVTSQEMEDVVVINTGYQKLKPNEMVGAVEVINKKMLNVNTGMTILDRLKGLTPSLAFDRIGVPGGILNNKLGISIRGRSTINGPADPLIVLDDFIYEGDIRNIDPNNIESVTILKDAVATSIWGVRAGNGVIVLTSKRAKKSARPVISFSSSLSVTGKPDLRKYQTADTRAFIELDEAWVNAGVLTGGYTDYESIEPLVSILLDRKKNKISAADSARLVDELTKVDFRDEYLKAFYQPALLQNYSLSVSHGTDINKIYFSANYSKNETDLKAVNDRFGFNVSNQLKLSRNLNLSMGIDYYTMRNRSGAPAFRKVNFTSGWSRSLPYARFYEPDGSPTGYGYNWNKNYLDTAGKGLLLDWLYYPAEDYKHNYTKDKGDGLNLNVNLNYQLLHNLHLQFKYGYQHQNLQSQQIKDLQSYEARDMINGPAEIDYATGSIFFPIPVGDIITTTNDRVEAHTASSFLNYTWKSGKHAVNTMLGFEIRSAKGKSSQNRIFGYSDDPLYFQPVYNFGVRRHSITGWDIYLDDYNYLNPSRATEQRSISNIFNMLYSYDGTYNFYLSFRKDGTNMFGLKVNDKWKPLWSAGASANLTKHLKHLKWISQLQVNATLGISGNIDMSKTSEAIAMAGITNYNSIAAATISQVNNPLLRWEKSKQLDFGVSFGFLDNFITGSFNYYLKYNTDLYGPEPFDYTNFPVSFINKNGSKMQGNGFESTIALHPVATKNMGVDLAFSFGMHKDKITYYNSTYKVIGADGDLQRLSGVSPNSIFVYAFAGLNNEGDPMFYYDGKKTTDVGLIGREFEEKGIKASSVKYLGSRIPTLRTSIMPQFRYKNFSLVTQLTYEGKFYTRFTNIFDMNDYKTYGIVHKSYYDRWQKPGDELHTNIPKVSIPDPPFSFAPYFRSSDFVYKRGDNIRLNTVNLSYQFEAGKISYSVGARISNIGIIWSKEKDLKYKDFPAYSVLPKSYTFDFNITF